MQFNNGMTNAKETNNAWLYALTCECAAEFYEELNQPTMSKAYLEVFYSIIFS